MRTSYFLSLLLFALPALSTPYHICSSIPGDCIVSTGQERPGNLVRTVRREPGHHYPRDTVVDVHPPISKDHRTIGSVSGKSGLSIGRSADGKRLEWVREQHQWEFSPGAQREFHVVQVPGHEEFWLDAGSGKPVEVVGPDVGDVYWSFEPASF